jgi:hypothetical protein
VQVLPVREENRTFSSFDRVWSTTTKNGPPDPSGQPVQSTNVNAVDAAVTGFWRVVTLPLPVSCTGWLG